MGKKKSQHDETINSEHKDYGVDCNILKEASKDKKNTIRRWKTKEKLRFLLHNEI